jgi:hypothetical protein
MTMPIDRKALRKMLAHYRAWNKAKFADQVLRRGRHTPTIKWRMYQDLYAFGRQGKPSPNEWEKIETAKEWEAYYARIRKFEAWRRHRAS